MARFPGVELAGALAVWAGLASPLAAQGGWRQWDIHLRDGTRVEANPLGAPDRSHFSISVGGYEGHDRVIARSRIDYIAARGELPPLPTGRPCHDLVVRLDGTVTTGPITVDTIRYSEGTVRQRGRTISLADVAYLRFADRRATCPPGSRADRHPEPNRRGH